ncbi:DNA topoisomerase IB [Chthonobacter rhizosphaerae]|uniref:DNA topoisomerase IB n=1 Tax=Chthonobacter rhizosphaerae TaxID=2735553 RepID=UPI0015EF20F0|nr:DNA topoisomerase IB [Chthonobacter rhizosphaerae]
MGQNEREPEAVEKAGTPEVLEAIGLTYGSDEEPGIVRRRSGKGFTFKLPDGATVRDKAVLERIRKLVIPPAWTHVWISLDPNSHLQATGRDQKGRKQYRYHPTFSLQREAVKFEHLIEFASVLPEIRARTLADLSKRGLPREKLLATVVRLLETTLIRIGNEDYAKENKSFGLTTLRCRHVAVEGQAIRFCFKGKSGKEWRLKVSDRRVAKILRTCQELPGQRLFQYVDDDGTLQAIDSSDVNAYLKEITGKDVTAKDFRTWAGTVQAALALAGTEMPETKTSVRKALRAAIVDVSAKLGNTPSVCRKSYVHPEVLTAFEEGALALAIEEQAASEADAAGGLEPYERAVLDFLTARMALAREAVAAEAKPRRKARRSAAGSAEAAAGPVEAATAP